MSEKKRKRRSFWEPDSEKLVSWLDDQSDLGTSLQLIIVDAIHKYGEGDVIKAHLNQRENAYYQGEPQTPARKPAPAKAVSRPEPSDKEEDRQESEEPAPLHVPEPEGQQVSGGDPEQKLEVELESEAELESEPESEGDEEMEFDISDMVSEADDDKQDDKEPEYDPVSIMMEDIGSTFSK